MKHLGLALALLLSISLYDPCRSAKGQVVPGPAAGSIVEAAVKDLQSGSADVQQGAEVRLYTLGPEDFPAIEAASKRAGLKPAAAASLKTIVDTVRPLIGRRTRAVRTAAAIWQWAEKTALTSYDAIGKRNPKWDQAARDGFARAYEPGEALNRFEALDRAAQLGCDDPLLLALKANLSAEMRLADPEVLANDLAKAADAMIGSRYPSTLTLPAIIRAGVHPGRQVYKMVNGKLVQDRPDARPGRMLQTALRLWPEVLKDQEIPEGLLLTRAKEFLQLGNRAENASKPTFDKVFAAMEKEPRHSAITLIFRGSYYTDYAWDARGRGFANTVTPEGAKLMQERLVIAGEALTKAYDFNPNDPEAPTAMMGVELGQGNGKEALEIWFKRAMKADPDNYQACQNKLYYLEPKWYGSPQEMLAFARECRDSNNWYAHLPTILIEAHERLSHYTPTPQQYYQMPGVWADLQSVFKPLLNAWPESAGVRSKYAYLACMCGQWAEARNQFTRLGNNADPKAFGDDSKMSDMREKAMNGGR